MRLALLSLLLLTVLTSRGQLKKSPRPLEKNPEAPVILNGKAAPRPIGPPPVWEKTPFHLVALKIDTTGNRPVIITGVYAVMKHEVWNRETGAQVESRVDYATAWRNEWMDTRVLAYETREAATYLRFTRERFPAKLILDDAHWSGLNFVPTSDPRPEERVFLKPAAVRLDARAYAGRYPLADMPIYELISSTTGRPSYFRAGHNDNQGLRYFMLVPTGYWPVFQKALLPDQDRDGENDILLGGRDFDDLDPQVYPGALERKSLDGKDNNCDPCSVTSLADCDKDGDGYPSIECFNKISPYLGDTAYCDLSKYRVDRTSRTVRGLDCDDNNPSIFPGAIMYHSPTQYTKCGYPEIYTVEAGYRLIRQPDGRALQVAQTP